MGRYEQQDPFLKSKLSRRRLLGAGFFGGVGLLAAGLVGCGDDDDDDDGGSSGSVLDQARERGYIRIGFANEAPYGYATSSGEVTGEAPDVAREVLSRLGIDEIDGVVTTFGALIPGLQAGRFDIIAAGMFINPDRCEQILFSDPDYCIPQAFAVEAGNPLGLMSYEDVAANPDVRLGVLAGAVEGEQYAPAAGISDDQLVIFDTQQDMGEGLQAGRIDAFALTSLSVRTELERLGDSGLESTDAFTPVVDGVEQAGCGGYGFRTDDEELRDAFNDVLVEMKENDEILPITEPHGFLEAEIGAAQGRTAEELCSG